MRGDNITYEFKQQINTYIKLLNILLSENTNHYELSDWIPNCIECLEFALNNGELLKEKPSLYEDTIRTINLLYLWIVEDKSYAYIELRQKFKTVGTSKEVGTALKKLIDRMKEENSVLCNTENVFVSFMDNDGNFKSTVQILKELSDMWNDL